MGINYEHYHAFHELPLAGTWRRGRASTLLSVSDPFNGNLLASLTQATLEDLNDAYLTAAAVQLDWARKSPAFRAEVMLRAVQVFDTRRDEIIDWIIRESGSTRIKAMVEWSAARAITLESASFPTRVHGRIMQSNVAGKENRIYREPLGVIGVISPWNFPLHLTQRSVAPALALGNSVVIKPASDTPICGGLLLARIFEEAGLPAGVLSVVVGAGSEIGDAFVEHPVPKFISFTGSTPIGLNIGRLACGQYLKHVALELGGNSPFVVLADADLELAVNAAVMGKFFHQGQVCMAINRIIVEAPVYESFIDLFAQRVRGLKVGDPNNSDTVIGPIINSRQREALERKIARAEEQGARVIVSSQVEGQLVPPHVFADVTADMDIAKEEIFGPLVGIQRADDREHALTLANLSEFGLSSSVFTSNLELGVAFARQISAGMSHVNDIPINDEPHVPFGGEKNSGLGRFNGEWAINEFTTDHWVSIQSSPRKYPF